MQETNEKTKAQLFNRLLKQGLQELLRLAGDFADPAGIDRVLDWINELDEEFKQRLDE